MTDTPTPPDRRPASLAELGALIGDPIRAAILLHLSDGTRRPAGELARLAGASPQACSAHLARLVAGGLLSVEKLGRSRVYAIASGEMAELLETMANWLDRPRHGLRHDPALCTARLCYDHLAGRLGVALVDSLVERGFLQLGPDGPRLSAAGDAWCRTIGIAVPEHGKSRRPLVRFCHDWTERRPHLGGQVGAALAAHCLGAGLVQPGATRRSLLVTARGRAFFRTELGVTA